MKRTRSGHVSTFKHHHVRHFVDSTSDFRKIDVNSLNIVGAISLDGIPKEVYVSDLSSRQIREIASDPKAFQKIERKSKTFVQHLLEKLEFGEYPLMIQPQPIFKFKVHTKEISSKYDYAVIKGARIMLVEEDKHIRNTGPASAWGEHKIAGELISGACCNYAFSSRTYEGILYAVRAIGLRFTFYKAHVSPSYLDSLGDGLPEEAVEILRYPSLRGDREFPYLDYGDPAERRDIVDMLVRMRVNIAS